MNILFNAPYDLFAKRTSDKYTGPLHFSSMFVNSFEKSKHRFTCIVFEKMSPVEGTHFESTYEKQGKNSWLALKIWIPTGQIIQSKKKMDTGTRSMIDQVKQAIAETKPDLYFLSGFSALTFLILQAVHELGVPVVTTHHGVWFREYMALDKKLVPPSTIPYRKELEMDTVRFAKKNVFLSNMSLQIMEKNLIKVPKNQLTFIRIPYNPVFVNKKFPSPNKDKKLNILMVGRWDGVKNHEAYLALAKAAKKKKLPWTFHAVCNIGNYPHYNKIAKEYQKYIKVVPAMAPKDLKKMYEQSNITILPSHFDVYPGVVTESVLQNRPVLISKNVGWVDEFEKHGVSHWITDFTKPEQVLKKIESVSKESVPKSLYNDIVTNNNPESIFKKYFKLFEEAARL